MSEKIVVTAIGAALLRRSNRKTLGISVLPDGAVELAAPNRARVEDILGKVAKHAPWIGRQRRTFADMNASRAPRRYTSGATHRFLGRQYRLKVRRGKVATVKLFGAFFHVVTRNGTETEVQEALSGWMRSRALDHLNRRVETWGEWCRRHRLAVPHIHLRSMPKRWGSATRDGRIWFNPELIRAPSICIDYVVAHEVCHLKYPAHSPEFYRQLDQMFPNWREVKKRLECAEL